MKKGHVIIRAYYILNLYESCACSFYVGEEGQKKILGISLRKVMEDFKENVVCMLYHTYIFELGAKAYEYIVLNSFELMLSQ